MFYTLINAAVVCWNFSFLEQRISRVASQTDIPSGMSREPRLQDASVALDTEQTRAIYPSLQIFKQENTLGKYTVGIAVNTTFTDDLVGVVARCLSLSSIPDSILGCINKTNLSK